MIVSLAHCCNVIEYTVRYSLLPPCMPACSLRKVVGGAMRQAGVIAAAGLVALKEGPKKLPSDHARTKSLARGLAAIPGVKVDMAFVQTNIIFFDLDTSSLSSEAYLAKSAAKAPVPGFPELTCPVPNAGPDVITPDVTPAASFCKLVEGLTRVKMSPYGSSRLRAVLHHQVTDDDVELLLKGAEAAVALLRK